MTNLKQTIPNGAEFQENNQNPNGQADIPSYTEEEYKNLQAFGTKANQGLINVSKKLAEKDPTELLGMDAQIQNKVIKDVWGYDNLDELKIMLPKLFEINNEGVGEEGSRDDIIIQMQREQELLKMKLIKKEVDDEIDKFTTSNNSIVSSIPNFETKVREELQNISSNLTAKERVERATRLISGSDVNVEAYLQLQGKNIIKSKSTILTEDYIMEAQNKLRAQLGLKQKTI